MKTEFAPLFKLGRAERLGLVEDLWDSIAAEDINGPVSGAKISEVHRRRKNFHRHPDSGRTWEEVKNRARTK